MYIVAIFALVLLSPLPFISPFDYHVQDTTVQSLFGQSYHDVIKTRNAYAQDLPPIALSSIQLAKLGVSPVSSITDGTDYPELDGASSITTTQIDGSTYALVAANRDDGVQIINISNPASPSPIVALADGTGGYRVLDGASSITTTQIDGSTYALVAAFTDDGVQIINISNPASPSLIAAITDGINYPELGGASSITTTQIDGSTYALVAAFNDDGVQIINITNPASPSPIAALTDGADYPELDGAISITTTKIDGSTYALVAAQTDFGVQIINITNPASPSPIADITDGADYPELFGATSITTTQIDGSTYALVTAIFDAGVQIINITNPASPSPIADITDGTDYPELAGAYSITTTKIDGSIYALVTAQSDNGVQIINITNPASPSPIADITDGADYPELNGATSITTTKIDGTTYALVTAQSDDGVQIIKLENLPPVLPLSIYTSTNNVYANEGDTLTIELNVNDTIATHDANIVNLSTSTINTNDGNLVASITIPSSPIEEYATFTITVANSLGVSLDITQNDLPSDSNIFVDTIPPRISLISSADYTILQNTIDPFIPGATVEDGDPNYSGNYAVTSSGTLDTSIVGSTVLYTYTADADGAGNPGQSTTRTVTVIDAEPIHITALTITSNGNDNIYAREGENVTVTLTTDGTDLGNVTGRILGRAFTTSINDGSATFTNLVEPGDNGNATFSITVTNSSGNQITITQDDITDTSFVTTDTIKPVITLNGDDNIVVIQNSTYTDAGAIATDASYGTQTVPSIDTVDTSTIGIYNLSYKAPDDPAGNLGPSITRTVHVQDYPPIELTSLTLTSDNTNPVYATTGNTLNGIIYVNDTIVDNTINILQPGLAPDSVIPSGNGLFFLYEITNSISIENNATFNITITNTNGVNKSVTQDDITSGAPIFVDTVSPRISLISSANYTVLQNTPDPVIPGATVEDGDPNYSDSYTVTTNDTLDTNTIGSTVLYTYTADADGAGNPGQSTTRTVTVIDAEPIHITALTITSNGNDNIYAREGENVTVTLTTDGTDLGNVTGRILDRAFTTVSNTGGSATFTNLVEFGDNGNATFSITVTNSSGNQITVTQDDITDDTFVITDTIKPVITLTGSAITILQNDPYVELGSSISDSGNPTYNGTVSATLLDTSILGIQNITYTGTADAAGNTPDAVNRTITIQAKPLGVTSLTIQSDNANNAYAKLGDQITATLTVNGTIGTVTLAEIESSNATSSIASNIVTINKTVTSSDADTNNASFTITVTNEDNTTISTFTNADLTGSPLVIDQTAPTITLNGLNNIIAIQNSIYTDAGAIATDASYGRQTVLNTSTIDTTVIGNHTLSYTAPPDLAGNLGPTITRTVSVQDLPPIALSTIQLGKLGVSPASSITDSANYPELAGASSITTTQIDGSTYALVAAQNDDGVQIINISNPASPSPIADITDGTDYPELSTPLGITTTKIDGSTYALVAAFNDDSVQIINISNPASPSPIADITDGTDYPELNGASSIITTQIDGSTYALVASNNDDGVQIINISNPASPSPIADITDGTDYPELNNPLGITTTQIDGSTYALVASQIDNGVQIIDITNPASPSPIADITDGTDYPELNGASSITTTKIDGSTYALVAANVDSGVQIINISNPASPSPIANITDGTDYPELNGAYSITTTKIDGSTYALVAALNDNGVQIINITNPASPSPIANITDGTDYPELNGASGITTTKIDGSTYALVAARFDNGVQIIKLENIPPVIPLSIITSTNNAYANTGDKLTIELNVNDIIDNHAANIANLSTPTINTNDGNLVASITIPSSPIEEYATFIITVANSLGVSLDITQNDLPSDSNIFIDTIPPRISLISPDYTVLQNTPDPVIPGAIATDGDPNYSGTFTVTTSGTLDTSLVGSTVLYTYTADADGAGNTGQSTTRTVTVIDAEPITVTGLTVASSNGNNYARVGQTISITLTTDGTDLGNVTGTILGRTFTNSTNGGSATFTSLVESGDNAPLSFSITVTNSSGNAITITQESITSGSVTTDTINPEITLNGLNNTITTLNTPYIDPGAIATDASYGTRIVQPSSNPVDTNTLGNYTLSYTAPPDLAGNLGPTITRTVSVQDLPPIAFPSLGYNFTTSTVTTIINGTDYPRLDGPFDIATIKIDGATYALVTVEHDSNVQIINISDPASPSPIDLLIDGIDHDYLRGGRGITTTQIDGSTYALVAANGDVSMTILNITNPTNSSPVSFRNYGIDFLLLKGAHDIASIQINNSIYALMTTLSGNSVEIFDITNVADPIAVAKIINSTEYPTLDNPSGITTTQIDGSTYALVAANVGDGIQIINITDPANPSPTANIIHSTEYPTLDSVYDITTTKIDGYTYAFSSGIGIQIINITDPANPSPTANLINGTEYPVLTNPREIAITQLGGSTYALVAANGDDGIQIINITDPANPSPTANIINSTEYPALERPRSIAITQIDGITYALVTAYFGDGIQIIKLENIQIGSSPLSIKTSTNNAYVNTGDTLTIELNVNDTIATHTANIANLSTPTITTNDGNLVASITIPSSPIEEYATFIITVANSLGVSLDITQNDLPSNPNIFIDTVSPRIYLASSANYTVLQNTTDLVIPGATVEDGDPNYSGNYAVTSSGTLDTSIVGSTVLYTYTADADGAGNPGQSIIRTVTIVDVEPINVTSLTVSSSNDNNYARAGQNVTVTLTTDGTDLGNVTGHILDRAFTTVTNADGSATFTGIVESGDNGNATFSITVTNSSGNEITITQDDITDDTYVTTDTINPTITLIGDNNTIIRLGDPYVDPGATAYDASYDGDQTIYSADIVNTNVARNYTLSYTASDDPAGNLGQTITRTVSVQDLPPINIISLTINSTNLNPSYAKAGDTLTIRLSVNDTITSDTVNILDQDISATVTNDTLTAFTTVPTSAVENNATFSINITNSLGVPRAITQIDLTSSNVFVDTIAPRIDHTNQFITQNALIPDADAIALDDDPYYDNTIPTPIGSIDNTTIGVYFRTYTPNPDNAGNIGENATQIITVTDPDGTVHLNTTVINTSSQYFDRCTIDAPFRVTVLENTLEHNHTLEICSPAIELNLSSIATSDSAPNTTVTYEHNFKLEVSSRITVYILKSTIMTSITDYTNSSNFTIARSIDEYRDTTVKIGSDNASYTLTNSAIGITFENIPASHDAYIRHNPDSSYDLVSKYDGPTITNGIDALAKINANSTFNDALYQYNPSSKTGTVWTLHLSEVKTNGTSSSSDDESSSNGAPTIGKTGNGARLVTNGFQYNDLIVDAERYHTELPLLGTNVGEVNTIKIKVYDGTGPEGIKRVEFALGVPDIGLYHSAEAFIEVWMEKDTLSVKEIIIEDDLNILENSDISATVSQTSCSGDQTQCLLLELQYSYREPPVYNTIAIKPVDRDNDAYQFYFNDGIHVDGDSINLPKEMQISTSHAINHIHTNGTLHLIQTDRAENMWIDQYGFQWKIIGNTIRQITMPEYIVPTDNKAGILHGPDRNHPDFELTKYAEQLRAQATLAEMLGKSTFLKPYPEHGGTIYFNATDRDGEAFKLLLELETERMEQIASLLYENDQ